MQEIGIMDVGGFQVGHAQDLEGATGCTVILCDRMSPAGLDVRGGGPASRESQILNPVAAAEGINAVLLSGGSAFGLDAAGGVQRYLEERGIGCSIGKYRGMDRAMKSGFGTFALQAGPVKVGALVAVNALGDVYSPDGKVVAGLLDKKKSGLSCTLDELFSDASPTGNLFTGNTTLGVIVTNAQFSKTPLTKIAGMAHNGYARAIRPVHTTADGDSIYALSVGSVPGDVNLVGTLAAQAMEMAILRAVQTAKSAYGLIGLPDLSH